MLNGDKHVVQGVIFKGRLAGALEEMQLIPILIFETKNKRKNKINKKKRRTKQRLNYRVPDH